MIYLSEFQRPSFVDRVSPIDATVPLPPAAPPWASSEQRLTDIVFRYPSRPDAPAPACAHSSDARRRRQ